MHKANIEIHNAQSYYGNVVHSITVISCLIALVAPVLMLLFPKYSLSNPNMAFGAVFDGQKPTDIWNSIGAPFSTDGFWNLFFTNIFSPDGFAISGLILGCSVPLWGLIPPMWAFIKNKEYLYAGISTFVMLLMILAMTGIVKTAS